MVIVETWNGTLTYAEAESFKVEEFTLTLSDKGGKKIAVLREWQRVETVAPVVTNKQAYDSFIEAHAADSLLKQS